MKRVTAPPNVWRLGSAAVILAFAFDPLGASANVAVLAIILVASFQVLLNKPVDHTTNVALLVLSALIVIIAALEILNPNVPSLTVGLLGFRKSATFVLGVIIGLGWRGLRTHGLRVTWWCMFITAAASLAIHLAFPQIEKAIPRDADKYTALIRGVERMQGFLAGPFHISMLGVFLFLSALAPRLVIAQRWVRVSAAGVGLACVYFAQVRTGLVALAVGAVVMMLATGTAQRWARRLIVIAGLCLLGVLYVDPLTQYANQFTALRLLLNSGIDDSRFGARFTSWSTGWDMVSRSPLMGYGSGSSGDTLGSHFIGGEHVTSHNTFLKYAVEGGVVQGALFLSLIVGLAVAVRPRRDPSRFGLAALVTFVVFGLVGAAPESIPVSFALAVIIGLCAHKPVSAQPNSPEAGRSFEVGAIEVTRLRGVRL